MRILVIEDDQRLSAIIKKGLTEDGFAVDRAFDGEEGLYLAQNEPYDLVILDIMLPKTDGVTVCNTLRAGRINTPILMLTAKSRTEDKVSGLDSGADDYMTKPFSFAEFRSRVHALVRRGHTDRTPVLAVSDLVIDPLGHTVERSGRQIRLTPKEFAILELLMRRRGEVVSRTMITEHVWDYNFDTMSNVVDVFVASLRKKIDSGHTPGLIRTVHGVGYRIDA